MVEPYPAMAIQPEVKTYYITGRDARAQARDNLNHMCNLLDKYVPAVEQQTAGMSPKLVVFPESFLHGFGPYRTRTYETNVKMAQPIPGEETDALGEKCKKYGFYLAGSMFEKDPEFPNHFFNTGFIIDPHGKVILKYRKINTSNNPIELSTSPHDVLEAYGNDPEKIFPVVRTPIGNLGVYICWDGSFPEVARCLALNGAEVFIRPNAWTKYTVQWYDIMCLHNRARALENTAYIVTPNWARSPQSEYSDSTGHSMIVDYTGRIIVEQQGLEEGFVQATLDIEALRRQRRKNKYGTTLYQLRTELYAEGYKNKKCWPANKYWKKSQQTQDEKWKDMDEIIASLIKEGII